MHWKEMDGKKKTCIILGAVCFACGLAAFAMGQSIVALVLFTVAAAAPLFAVSGEASDEMDIDVISSLQDKLDSADRELKAHVDTISTGQNEITTQKRLIDSRNRQIEALQKTITELEDKLQAIENGVEPEEVISEEDLLSSILPRGKGKDAEKQTLDITAMIKKAANDFKGPAAEAGVEIKVLEPDTPMYVSAAPVMLRTMFRDIIDNALKYMQRAGTLQITVANFDDDIFVAMKDNGQGLAESETEHIFELNFQGSNRISGNGLGLAQVKAIVDHYGGMIYAKSSPGRGMGIYVHLPAERV